MDLAVEQAICNGNPTLTSRISLQKFCCVVAQFDQQKRELAKETGFGGLLEIQISHKTNLKLSSFLMERLDPASSKVVLGNGREIEITDLDVQNVFALPNGSRLFPPGVTDMSEPCIEFTKLATNYSSKGIHSLKASESVILRPLGPNATRLQRDCFKIAYVVFSIGHVLNPSAKHDYTSVEYWAALVVPSEINSFNWCRYVRENLLKGATKMKTDISQHTSTVQIIGCHLLLQVTVLDKISTSSCLIPQNIYPRIKVFDHATIKRAIQAVTHNVFGGTVFIGPNCNLNGETPECSQEPSPVEAVLQCKRPKKDLITTALVVHHSDAGPSINIPSRVGPTDYANQMRRKYPNMAGQPLGILLTEHNSRILARINEIRHCTQMAMFNLMDNLVNCLADSCTCCKLSGRESCLLSSTVINDASGIKAPLDSNGRTNIGFTPPSGDISTGCTDQPRKRCYAQTQAQSEIQNARPKTTQEEYPQSGIATVENQNDNVRRMSPFLDDIISSVIVGYNGIERLNDNAGFAQCTDQLATPLSNVITDFNCIPVTNICPVNKMSSIAGQFIEVWVSNASTSTLSSVWFRHPSPRFISVEGTTVRREIAGLHKLSHECCAIICRRLCQLDLSEAHRNDTSLWRKIMEPDFTTIVLRGIDPRYVKSIQRELLPANRIDKARMEGWCCYLLDMKRKRIIVNDPFVGPAGFDDDRVKLHEYISNKILVCFFLCIKQLYKVWHCNEFGWTRSFSTLTAGTIESHDIGLSALFMALNHDGEKLAQQPSKRETPEAPIFHSSHRHCTAVIT